MNIRKIKQVIPALGVTEGAGVMVYRSIGTPPLKNLDPFLMLDLFSSTSPDDYIAGFPPHPHRGFITLTYMIEGNMRHQDSMGNEGHLKTGGIQWMKAASGVIHSEMPEQEQGAMRGFQLWINLPAAEKMSDPQYQEFKSELIPLVKENDKTVKVISGTYANKTGPINDPHTKVTYLDVELAADATFNMTISDTANVFITPYENDVLINNTHIAPQALAVLTTGNKVEITAGNKGARFILLSGEPLNEPIMQQGPFVMNTEEEIKQAFEDYKNNQLVKVRAEMVTE